MTRKSILALAAILIFALARDVSAQWWNPHQWPFTFIPIPEVATDPNSGTTYGVLPVLLFNDERHQIRNIIAPDITENTILGAGGTFRYLGYPSSDTQYYITAGAAEKILRRVDAVYSTGRNRDKWWSLDTRIFFERDPTERFFGIGNESHQKDETNFTTEQINGEADFGINLTKQFQVTLATRPRRIRFFKGALKKLPFLTKKFPNLKDADGGSDFLNRMVVSWDTRDSVDIPRAGGLIRAFAAVVDRSFGSSESFTQFGAELRRFHTIGRV